MQDIVDILIGWYIDPEQDADFLDQIDKALVKLQTFWLNDMNFTLTLLSQFLEDAERYVTVKAMRNGFDVFHVNFKPILGIASGYSESSKRIAIPERDCFKNWIIDKVFNFT